MKVSIIIPAFNAEKHIGRCIDSAINQTLDNSQYEIIIINDCSSDKTLDEINKYSNKFNNFSIINNTKIEGPGISRNKGLKFSSGKYIFFLDSDDYISHNAIKILYEKGNKYNADVIGYNFTKIVNTKKHILKCRKDINKIQSNKKKLIKNFLYGEMDGSVIFSFIKRKIILENNISFKKGIHEDILFIFKVYYFSKKIIRYNKDIYFKVNRNSSILNTFSSLRILDLITAFKDVYKFFKKNNKKLAKEYFQIYMRGFVGCIGTFLIQNFKYCIKNKKLRYKNYLIIYRSIKNDFENVPLSQSTYKDKLTKAYIEEFDSRINFKKSAINYEKRYNKIKLVKY